MSAPLVLFVPGFFGFTAVGAVSHFADVERTLDAALRRLGVKARIVCCSTRPTASIPRRAHALPREVRRRGALKAPPLHFGGHLTGGLDMRLQRTPRLRRVCGAAAAHVAAPTRTEISVATPQHGTPLANHFTVLHGQTLLMVLSALATLVQGRGVIVAAAHAIALAARLHDWPGRAQGPLDRTAADLHDKLRFDRNDPVWRYLDEVSNDHGAVLQLTPEAIDHPDTVGHYTLAGGHTADRLPSGAGYITQAFEATWDAVAAAIAGER